MNARKIAASRQMRGIRLLKNLADRDIALPNWWLIFKRVEYTIR